MTDSPSVLLQRAAELIERGAAEANQGTWKIDDPDWTVTNISGDGSVASDQEEGACEQEDARWICMMSPAVAAPLVAWLRFAQAMYEAAERRIVAGFSRSVDLHVTEQDRAALELARTVLGLPSKAEESP